MNKNIIFWLVIILLILLGIFGKNILNGKKTLGSSQSMKTDSNISSMPGTITVKGFNYGYTPKTITVKEGDMVMLKFVSDDSPHTFTIDELGVNQQFTYGKDASAMFTASKKGTFQFYCAVPGHKEEGMIGTLIVK